jgi:serine phosphatase RsbU (regulator of sigma subunit)
MAGVTDDLRFLASVGEALTDSLDLSTRLDVFVNAVVPRLADWATVNLLGDDGSVETRAIAHRDPAQRATAERLRGPFYANPNAAQGTPSALRSRRPALLTGVDETFLRRHIRPEMFADVLALGADSAFIVPLIAHGRVYGTLSAMRTAHERPFREDDLHLIEELARRAAAAIANAKLFERSATIAEAFQEASLPQRLPRVAGAAFSAYYAPGRAEAMVGGDWYDAFTLDDGRVAVSIGDVAGSGLQAAVLMGSVRQLIRGAAQLQTDPASILDATDRALRGEYPEAIVTAVVGIVDTAGRGIDYASAGHPPPLLRGPDGAVVELDAFGLPLGLRVPGHSHGAAIGYQPGSLLVLYTDGLIESTRDILEGESRLRAELAQRRIGEASNAARALHDAVLAGGASDDVAILTVSLG